MNNGFFYRPGVWNSAYIDWNAGFKLRVVGVLFILVGCFVFGGCIETGVLLFQLFPLIYVVVGIWVLLIGLGKVKFYDLRRDIAIKVILGIIIGGWLVVFAFILLTSFTSFKNGEIPLTFILVTIVFLGQQVYEGLFLQDNISNLSHVLGGIVGAIVGDRLNKK